MNHKVNVSILMGPGTEQEPAFVEVLERILVREVTEKQEYVLLVIHVSCPILLLLTKYVGLMSLEKSAI